MDIDRATIEPGLTTYGNTRRYVCATGSVLEGDPTIECQQNFKWSDAKLYCRRMFDVVICSI